MTPTAALAHLGAYVSISGGLFDCQRQTARLCNVFLTRRTISFRLSVFLSVLTEQSLETARSIAKRCTAIFTLLADALSLHDYGYTGSIASPEDFLKAIGRSSETKVSYEAWDEFWTINGVALKKAGLPVRDRRCARTKYDTDRDDAY